VDEQDGRPGPDLLHPRVDLVAPKVEPVLDRLDADRLPQALFGRPVCPLVHGTVSLGSVSTPSG
jgi:hypothetical protein